MYVTHPTRHHKTTYKIKSNINNANKIAFMREQIAAIKHIEKQFPK